MTIYKGIYGPYRSSNRVYIRVYIAIYRGIYRLYRSSNGVYIRVYIPIYRSSPIGRVRKKRIINNLFFSLIIFTPSLPLPSLLERKGAGVIPFPSLLYSIVYIY